MKLKHLTYLIVFVSSVMGALWLYSLPEPLTGTHKWRQADTLITAYYYCTESLDFGRPKVAARVGTSGIAVGEFPLFSYVNGLLCKAQGFWSEATPKIVNLLFLVLAFFAWLKFLQLRFGRRPNDTLFWSLAFLFTPISLAFFTIPMPESIAMAFFGGAAWLWETGKLKSDRRLDLLASIVFFFGFMIRPYHIYILFFIAPTRMRQGQLLVLCVAGFFLWYRWWAAQVTTLPGYFGINFEGIQAVITWWWHALSSVPSRLFDQTAIIGAWFIWKGWRHSKLCVLGFLASWATMLLLKPYHIPAHSYYLLNAAFFASVLMFLGLRDLPVRQAVILGGLFVLISVSNTIHNFYPNREWAQMQPILQERQKIDPQGTVITYMGNTPRWLYYFKAHGLRREGTDYRGPASCPEGITSLMYEDAAEVLHYELCQPAKPL